MPLTKKLVLRIKWQLRINHVELTVPTFKSNLTTCLNCISLKWIHTSDIHIQLYMDITGIDLFDQNAGKVCG